LLNKGIIPVYVFDGKPPELKRKVLDLRKNIRKKAEEKLALAQSEEDKIKYFKRSVIITKKHLEDCRELLDYMGVPYIDAPEEADSQCAWLAKNNLVDAVLTEDMDILTFGSPYIIRNLTSFKKKPLEISKSKILEKFEWTHEQFVHFCILLGCDYCDNISESNCFEIFKIYQRTKDINEILKYFNKNINYTQTIEYFNNPIVNKANGDLEFKNPNLNLLTKLLVDKHGLIKFKIQRKLTQLNNAYNLTQKIINKNNELVV
jgi:flap endonuclease-1